MQCLRKRDPSYFPAYGYGTEIFCQEDIALKNVHLWSKTKDPNLPSSKATPDASTIFRSFLPTTSHIYLYVFNEQTEYTSRI